MGDIPDSNQIPTRISIEEMQRKKQNDRFCIEKRRRIAVRACFILLEDPEIGILIHKAKGMRQVVVAKSTQQKLLMMTHYSELTRHPSGCRVYQELRRKFFWPAMEIE